jgi:hypothetical protein
VTALTHARESEPGDQSIAALARIAAALAA